MSLTEIIGDFLSGGSPDPDWDDGPASEQENDVGDD